MTEVEKIITSDEFNEIFESGKFKIEAKEFCNNLKKLAENPKGLEALEIELTYHFQSWLERWMNTPVRAVEEMEIYANC